MSDSSGIAANNTAFVCVAFCMIESNVADSLRAFRKTVLDLVLHHVKDR